jgi:NAD-reducing hydrogenase large subunit
MTQRLNLDQVLDPFSSRVEVVRQPDGRIVDARLDMAGLPRVDAMLAGRPVTQVPPLVERLCGVCPVAHHLAGHQALEALMGVAELPRVAADMRRVLHYGSVLQMHALRFAVAGFDGAAQLRRFGTLALAAAGSPGHFPVTAVVGGVAAPANADAVEQCRQALPEAMAAAQWLVGLAMAGPGSGPSQTSQRDGFEGANVALVDDAGRPDPMGRYLKAVDRGGKVVIEGATPDQWDMLVAEAFPGSATPRPYLIPLGPEQGSYRVGPMAQVRVGRLATPLAAARQDAALAGPGLAARAVMALHLVELVSQLLDGLTEAGTLTAAPASSNPQGVGVGWVDGARGLLVHRYQVAANGRMEAAQVLTPTAQNEYWLAQLLRQAVGEAPDGQVAVNTKLEDAIREADPCLPCSMAPPGQMGLTVATVDRAAGPLTDGA